MTSPNETLPADGSPVRGREDAVSSAEAGARGWSGALDGFYAHERLHLEKRSKNENRNANNELATVTWASQRHSERAAS